jgi:enediyne biosynthesis thioesterase
MNELAPQRQNSSPPGRQSRAYVYRHTVSFEETNVVGNVYYARHVAWQGRCREMFLMHHAPEILEQLNEDLRLVTLHVSCDYFEELRAFDEVDVSMTLAHIRAHRIGLTFNYLRPPDRGASTIARGSHEIGCMRRRAGALIPAPIPKCLATALATFRQETGQQ